MAKAKPAAADAKKQDKGAKPPARKRKATRPAKSSQLPANSQPIAPNDQGAGEGAKEPRIVRGPDGKRTNTVEFQYLTDEEKELVAPTRKNTLGLGWFAGSDLSHKERAEKLRNFADHGTFEPAADAADESSAPILRDTRQPTTEETSGGMRAESQVDGAGDERSTPNSVKTKDGQGAGDVTLAVAEIAGDLPGNSLESSPLARARHGETKSQCWERLRREGRASGMTRKGAIAYASGVIERLFPPPEPLIVEELPAEEPEPEVSAIVDMPEPAADPEPIAVAPAPIKDDQGVSGLSDLPESWGELPDNASLQVEIAWVSANRLRVRSGTGVDLSRAKNPAPSYAALSWLETSILFPSKFADISVKATASQDDEKEHIRREKLAIEEIRSILGEMLEG